MQNNKLVIGILAHVDAGKTTLSEGILYETGTIRKWGRVDHKDAFLDTNQMEKDRGITIFSKQAQFTLGAYEVALLDTPGHVDFSAEMERTLPLLDYAILVISGADGVQAHTKTLWRLLRKYEIPTFLFINKMDQNGCDKSKLMQELTAQLGNSLVDFSLDESGTLMEEEAIACCEENVLEQYLETGVLKQESIQEMIANEDCYPCYFGSALKQVGIDTFLKGLETYVRVPEYPMDFAARVYKIGRDEKENRLTYLKCTGGRLRVKDVVNQEKINQIRIYSGAGYETVDEILPGGVYAVTGLNETYAGQGLGSENDSYVPMLEPVLNYRIQLPEDMDPMVAYQKLQRIEEEEPLLHLVWDAEHSAIHAQLMGQMQCEILKQQVLDRLDMEIGFDAGAIVYKETIAEPVEGVGHYEPLRHYAEAHLLIEPGVKGSGIQIDSVANEDKLDRNWQRLILTHVVEKRHRGVLIGAELTDVKITLVAGRAHQKHTEGGDFRQATYRAIRHGLMQAQSVLLEPMYAFTLTIPADKVGRAMTDIQAAFGRFDAPEIIGETAVITGVAPVATTQDYGQTVLEYTKGEGQFQCRLFGYEPCHNQDEIVEGAQYDPTADVANTPDSVFCAHGAGFVVPWYQVRDYMHVDSGLSFGEEEEDVEAEELTVKEQRMRNMPEYSMDEEEMEAIFRRTFGANANAKKHWAKKPAAKTQTFAKSARTYKRPVFKDKYLLVDGYNIVFAWEDLKDLANNHNNLDGARIRLQDMMCNYQAYKKVNLIVVFDAYKVKGNPGDALDYHNIHVVFTKEAQTADAYIEKFTRQMSKDYDITVATSDALEQMIVLGAGAKRMSARDLLEDVDRMGQELREKYLNTVWE